MAGVASSSRRWMLPSALLVALLARYGGENATPSYVPDAGEGQYWQCPGCQRVEWWPDQGTAPRCDGNGGMWHRRMFDTELLEGEDLELFLERGGLELIDGRRLFR